MGGLGVRRASAVLLLGTALLLMALGLVLNSAAASVALLGALIGAVVATLDVDKLTGRG